MMELLAIIDKMQDENQAVNEHWRGRKKKQEKVQEL